MKLLPFFVAFLVVVVLAVPSLQCEESEDTKLQAFFKTFLDNWFRQRPLDATRFGDRNHDDRLDDLSAKAREAFDRFIGKTLDDLPKAVSHGKLTRSGQIDFEILRHHLTREKWLAQNSKPYAQDPRVYNEYVSDSVFLLLTQSTAPRERNVANAAARIKQIPRIIDQAKENLTDPVKVYLETAIKQNKGSIDFHETGIYTVGGETAGISELTEPCKKAVAALKEYQKHLEGLLPKAKGEWRLGKEKFARKLELELDAGLSADQVLKDAEAEADRVEREMYVVARQLWSKAFPDKTIPPDDQPGRTATIRQVLAHYNRDHGKVEDLLKDAQATVAKIKEFIRTKDILKLPDPDRCKIIEMPEFQRGNSVAYLNQAPPLDTKASSYYAVSPPPRDWDARRVQSYMEEYNRAMLQILTIHEAYPGHYVQLEYSNRHPSLIRRVLFSGVFAEGWAVYTEQVMLDQGYGDGDLVLRLNQLKWYLRTVVNAILDHRMHCTNMTDDEALDLLTKRAFQSEGEALGKIVRAKQSSCQLSTYFVGRMAFYRLRQKVQREQGDKFVLGRFHEAVLSHGTLPVKYLPELVGKSGK